MESPNTVTPEQSVVPFAPHALEETRRTLTPHEAAAPKELTLRDYWHVLLRRKGAIGAFLLVVMMVVTLITLRTPSRYVSTGRISVSRENPDVAGFKNGVSSADSDTDLTMLLETQVQVIRSRHQSANPWNRRFASRPAMPNTIPILVCSSCSRNRTRRRHSRISVGRRN